MNCKTSSTFAHALISFLLLVIQFNSIAQRPKTDSIITLMYAQMQKGDGNSALALADIGFGYSKVEEPEYESGWLAFFSLRKMQILFSYIGDFEAGEEILNKIEIPSKKLTPDELYWWLQLLNGKGDHYLNLGDSETAKDLYYNSFKKDSKSSSSQIIFYTKLTILFNSTNQLDSADYYSQEAISLMKLKDDTLNSTYFNVLIERAFILAKLGDYERSNILINYVKKNYGKYNNPKSYRTKIHVLQRIASSKGLAKDYDAALKYSQECEELHTKFKGKKNLYHFKHLSRTAYYHYMLNQKDSAYNKAKKIPNLLIRNTQNKSHLLSLRVKEISLNKNKTIVNNLLFMLDYFDNKYVDYNKNIYDYILFEKTNTAQSLVKLKTYFEQIANSDWQEKFKNWQEERTDYFSWLGTHSANENTSKELANKLEDQEKELFKQAGLEYMEYQEELSWKNVSENLSNQSIAIEFVRYKHLRTEETHYGALLVSPNQNHPVFVKLYKESDLKNLLKYEFAETDYEYTQRLYQTNKLYDLIWKPLEPHMNNIEDCYVSLSGLLYKIALDASFPKEAPMHPNIHLLQSTNALVKKEPKLPEQPQVLLYGGITYSLDKIELVNVQSNEISNNVHAYHRDLQGRNWPYLKGTESEVKQINSLLTKKEYQVKLNLGSTCSESSLKTELESNSPNILHIATHGYYPVATDSVLSYTQTASYARSGLVMAGANTSKFSKAPIKGFGDGILTAPEITALDLSNTQLVVLSACESGKGIVSHVDEIYGLQRAFKITGAHYVIYTLWKIPDEPTKDFMVYFYKTLSEGHSIKESFFLTKEQMKKTQPAFYWAGFQLIE